MKDSHKFTVWLTDAASLVDATDTDMPNYYIDNGTAHMEEHGWIKVTTGEYEFERPTLKSIMPDAVAGIREEMRKINLKAAQETAMLEAKISKLMALEYDAGSK